MAFDFPSSPSDGAIYTPAGGPSYTYFGGVWRVLPPTTPATTTISDTPPGNPPKGQNWWQSSSGALFIWYDDGNSQQWVQVNGQGIADAPSDGRQYVRQGGVWVARSTIQTISMAGLSSSGTIAVPPWAKFCDYRWDGRLTTATAIYGLLQVDAGAGLLSANANYWTYGHYIITQGTAVNILNAVTTYPGMFIGNNNDVTNIPFSMWGRVRLERDSTAGLFAADAECAMYNSTNAQQNGVFKTGVATAATSSLRLQSLVFTFNVVNAQAAGSQLVLEWS